MSYYASSQPEVRVVQGTVVGANAPNTKLDETAMNYTSMDAGTGENNNAPVRGQAQPKRCNDLFWAFLFVAHLVVLGTASVLHIPEMYGSMSNEFSNKNQLSVEGGDRNLLVDTILDLDEKIYSHEEGEYEEFTLFETDGKISTGFVHALSTVVNAIAYGPVDKHAELAVNEHRQLKDNDDNNGDGDDYDVAEKDEFTKDEVQVVFLLITSFIIAFLLSSFTLGFMILFAEGLIKCALWFNIITAGFIAFGGLVTGSTPMVLFGLLAFGIASYYAYCVWSRVPFAASNLVAASTAVRSNFGVTFFAYAALVIAFLWSVWWAMTASATFYILDGCNINGECESDPAWYLVFLFFLSYFWTAQVIQNTVHVTVAGTVGTWFFNPLEASTCCSAAIMSAWIRSVTSAFGSICLGSLLVAIIQATKEIIHSVRENSDSIVVCLLECILGWIEWIFEYFNRWAFVYVGLYGYSFLEAGTNVINLFKARGWTTIIADNLVDNVLTMVSIGVGILTGLAGMLIGRIFNIDVGGEGAEGATVPFLFGFLFGFVICSVLMSVVSSAVNTVIVCYAEAPNEFQQSHPELSNDMRAAWKQAWPTSFNYA